MCSLEELTVVPIKLSQCLQFFAALFKVVMAESGKILVVTSASTSWWIQVWQFWI
jgi:hypothetical protein